MFLQIDDFTIEIKSFNVSSRQTKPEELPAGQNSEEFIVRMNVECTNTNVDLATLTNTIIEKLEENNIEIINNDSVYRFSNYRLEDINKVVTDDFDRLTISFIHN